MKTVNMTLGLLLLLGLAGTASAQGAATEEGAPSAGPAVTTPAASGDSTWLRGHRFTAYGTAGGHIYLSSARTMGGMGGGVGIRDTLEDRFILQADLSYLLFLGNVFSARLGAGIQRSGVWTPAVLVTLSALFGDRLAFLTPEHPTAVAGPAFALGLNVAPLRFSLEGTQVSVLSLGVGAGTDFPGLGLSYQVGLLEVGVSF